MSWGAPAADAAELAQDSIADAHLSLSTCRGNVNDRTVFGCWLRGIARNKFQDWSRRRQAFATHEAPTSQSRMIVGKVNGFALPLRLHQSIYSDAISRRTSPPSLFLQSHLEKSLL